MNDTNLALLEKNRDILSIRDLATGTIATYTSYLTDYINWVEENLPGRSLSDVTWEEIRSYEKYHIVGRKKTALYLWAADLDQSCIELFLLCSLRNSVNNGKSGTVSIILNS